MHPILCDAVHFCIKRCNGNLADKYPSELVKGLGVWSRSRFDCVYSTCSFNTSLFFGQREPLADKGTRDVRRARSRRTD
jgi:hypothetical protein